MKNFKLLPFSLFGMISMFFSLTACTTHPDKLPKVYLSDECKSYVDFAEGSYWIYKDSNSHKIDTIKCTKRTKELIMSDYNGCYLDFVYEILYSSFYLQGENSGIRAECEGTQIYNIGSARVFFLMNTQYVKGLSTTVIGDSMDKSLKYTASFDSLSIMNHTYYKVKVYKNKMGIGFIGQTIYWAKDVGVIRRETSDGRVWLLIGYHHT